MKVLFISYEFLPESTGGIGTYVHHACRMLLEANHSVSVICYGNTSTLVAIKGVQIYPLPCKDRQSFHAAAASMLGLLLKCQDFDVMEVPDLYAEGISALSNFPDLPSVMRLHTPLVVSTWVDATTFPWRAVLLQACRVGISELMSGRFPANALRLVQGRWNPSATYDVTTDLEREAALRATVLVSPSLCLARKVERIWFLGINSIAVSPNPYYQLQDATRHRTFSNPTDSTSEDVLEILYYGGLKTLKGVDVLVTAMAPLFRMYPQLRVTLAGRSSPSPLARITITDFLDGSICQWREMLPWLQAKTARLGPAVRILPWQAREQIDQLIADAHICVFPSRYDNFPGACMEAMAAGKAIVATNSGGMSEMLRNGESGLLVSPGRHRPLRAAIQRLICNAELRHELGQAAQRRYETRYRSDRILDQHVALYEKAIAIKQRQLARNS